MGITDAVLSLDGNLLFLESPTKGKERKLEAFDGLTGKQLWKVPDVYAAYPKIDSAGTVLGFAGKGNRYYLLDIASQTLDVVEVHPGCMSPKGSYYCGNPPGDPTGDPTANGLCLYQRGKKEPLLTLGLDSSAFRFPLFNSAGTHLAWPNPDGTFTLCDLEAVRRRLAEVGLGWEPISSAR